MHHLGLFILCAGLVASIGLLYPVDAKPKASAPTTKPAPCKRARYRLIGKERVPWDHDVDDHDWDEFDHSVEECEPPPC